MKEQLLQILEVLYDSVMQYVGGYRNLIVTIVFLVFLVIMLLYIRYQNIRKQYSDEAWKIVRKNGRKSIFWYDEYGNKTYKKPEKSSIPSRHKRGL